MSENMTAADVLREARRLIAEKRFARGNAEVFEPGAICTGLALDAVLECKPQSISSAVVRIFDEANGLCNMDWSTWHDAQPDKNAVLAAFDRAIALAESSPGDLP